VDECMPDEFAVRSGGPPLLLPDGGWGERPQPDLPASCHALPPDPSGWITYCCPCE
jgi:hypothetical protein